MNKIAIIGSSSSIGVRLYPYLKENLSSNNQIIGTFFRNSNISDAEMLDITDYDEVDKYISKNKPSTIIWLSATKDVKKCEIDKKFAYQINTKPIESLIRVIELKSPLTRVLYISSDYVFKGDKGFYKDSDECNPNTVYGLSKYASEKLLQSSKLEYTILRTSAVMIRENGFLGWLLNQLKLEKQVNLFSNTFFSPTPVNLLNQAIACIITTPSFNRKILNFAGPRVSRYEFGVDLVKKMGLKASLIAPEIANYNSSTFQKDLSLITSSKLKDILKNYSQELIKESTYV
jgi:dTDP-4-dehydrorhamnose reductase